MMNKRLLDEDERWSEIVNNLKLAISNFNKCLKQINGTELLVIMTVGDPRGGPRSYIYKEDQIEIKQISRTVHYEAGDAAR